MQRCPECEFIYEDEQRLCDMDGTALVHDSRILPENPVSLQSKRPATSLGRLLTIVAIPLAVLNVLLFFTPRTTTESVNPASAKTTSASSRIDSASSTSAGAGHASSSRSVPRATAQDGSSRSDTPKASVDSDEKGSEDAVGANQDAERSNADGEEGAGRIPKGSNLDSQSTASKRSPKNAKSQSNTEKVQDKVTGFLKKTGNILKKPFKR